MRRILIALPVILLSFGVLADGSHTKPMDIKTDLGTPAEIGKKAEDTVKEVPAQISERAEKILPGVSSVMDIDFAAIMPGENPANLGELPDHPGIMATRNSCGQVTLFDSSKPGHKEAYEKAVADIEQAKDAGEKPITGCPPMDNMKPVMHEE